jgi:hypothetical protein
MLAFGMYNLASTIARGMRALQGYRYEGSYWLSFDLGVGLHATGLLISGEVMTLALRFIHDTRDCVWRDSVVWTTSPHSASGNVVRATSLICHSSILLDVIAESSNFKLSSPSLFTSIHF